MEETKSKLKPIQVPFAKGLVLTRKQMEGVRIQVGEVSIDVIIGRMKGKEVRLVINAPKTSKIDRLEVVAPCTLSSEKEILP